FVWEVCEGIGGDGSIEKAVDRKRRRSEQQGVAVRRRARDGLGADVAAGARPVVDNDLLAQQLRQASSDDTGRGVGASTGRERRDQPNGTVRVSLRLNVASDCARCCERRGELHQSAADNRFFHGARRNERLYLKSSRFSAPRRTRYRACISAATWAATEFARPSRS